MVDAMGQERSIQGLVSSLSTEFRLEDPSFTVTVWEQEARIYETNTMAAGTGMGLPKSDREAIDGDYGKEWKEACDKEISILQRMNVWKEIKAPGHQKIVSTKWVFAYKYNVDGDIKASSPIRKRMCFISRTVSLTLL